LSSPRPCRPGVRPVRSLRRRDARAVRRTAGGRTRGQPGLWPAYRRGAARAGRRRGGDHGDAGGADGAL